MLEKTQIFILPVLTLLSQVFQKDSFAFSSSQQSLKKKMGNWYIITTSLRSHVVNLDQLARSRCQRGRYGQGTIIHSRSCQEAGKTLCVHHSVYLNLHVQSVTKTRQFYILIIPIISLYYNCDLHLVFLFSWKISIFS